jgi:hypothetical protein
LLNGILIGNFATFHLRQDVIARSVDDGVDGLQCVCLQGSGQGIKNGNPAADCRLKGDGASILSSGIEEFRPVLSEQCFVCGDNIFATFQQTQDKRSCRFNAANQFDPDGNIGISENGFCIIGHQAGGEFNIPASCKIKVANFGKFNPLARCTGNSVRVMR